MTASRWKRSWLLGAVLAIALGVPAYASGHAMEGRLDLAYGKSGVAMSALSEPLGEPDVELTSDGASVVVADGPEGVAARFRANGSWDTGFGESGFFVLRPGTQLPDTQNQRLAPDSITVDHLGRIVVFGSEIDTSQVAENEERVPVSPGLATVVRYGADGELDPTFGEGKGYVTGSFGLQPESSTGFSHAGALAGRVDARNRPVFVLANAGRVGGCYGHSTVGSVPRGLVRLTVSGGPDSSFGGGGVSQLFGAGEEPFLGFDAHDRPFVGTGSEATYAAECGEGGIVFRFRSDGARMDGFGSQGEKTFKVGHLAVVQPSGASVLSEPRGSRLEVTRVRPDGLTDPRFGHRGVSRVRLPASAASHVEPASVDKSGRVLLAGFVGSPGAFVIGRLLPNGNLDRSFGKNGWLFTRLPGSLRLFGVDATTDSKGRLLVGGIVRKPGQKDAGFAVARYLLGP
jgi:uncharacterized delta-60 repeat protein